MTLPLKLCLIGTIVLLSRASVISFSDNAHQSKSSIKHFSKQDSAYKSHPNVVAIDSLLAVNDLEAALDVFTKMAKDTATIPPGGNIYAGNRIGNILVRQQEFIKTINTTDIGRQRETQGSYDSLLLADHYYLKGVGYNFIDLPDSSEKYHHLALALRSSFDNCEPRNLINSYVGLGNVKRYMIHDYDSASYYYELASERLNESSFPGHDVNAFRCHYNLATTFRVRKNLDKSLIYARKALRNARSLESDVYILFTLNNLANIHTDLDDLASAEKYSKEIIAISNTMENPNYGMMIYGYINMGMSQINKEQYESAIDYLESGLKIAKSKLSEDPRYQRHIHEELGLAYQALDNKAMAIKHFNKSISALHKSSGDEGLDYMPYKILAEFYEENNMRDSALYYFQYALREVSDQFATDDFARVPLVKDIPHNVKAFDLIVSKAGVYKSMADEENKNENLKTALAHYLLADSIISIKRRDDLLESEELWIANDIQASYWSALECLYQLDSLVDKTSYANTALRFMDQNKANIMFRALRKSLFLEKSGVHDSLVQYNRDIGAALRHWQTVKEQDIDEQRKEEVENKIFQLISKKGTVDKIMRTTYQNFEKATYTDHLTVDKVRSLVKKDSSAVLEYYQAGNYLYCLTIAPNSTQLDKITLDSAFLNQFNIYLNQLSNKNPFDKKSFEDFKQSSHYLYNTLLPKGLNLQNLASVTIIPDGILTKMPFDALLTQPHNGEGVDYNQLKYLIKKIKINYYHNTLALLSNSETQDKQRKLKLGGWAYEDIPGNQKLLSTIKEVEDISKDCNKKLFTGTEATKRSFISEAAEYDILHLAIHGSDMSDSVYAPVLQFYPEKDNGLLHDYELYQMPISAKMVVLSACKTGSGAIQKGEGMFSMARSFFYAGCPSIVLSLWNLNDGAGSEIITSYYDYLKEGLKKDESLRAAKLAYLDRVDNYLSHPSNWAGTILIGDNDPLWNGSRPKINWPLILIGTTAVFLIFVFFYLRKSKLSRIHK